MSKVNHYGVLEQHHINDDVVLRATEEIVNLGYAVIDSGYTVNQVEEIAKVFDIVHSEYVEKYSQNLGKFTNPFYQVLLNRSIVRFELWTSRCRKRRRDQTTLTATNGSSTNSSAANSATVNSGIANSSCTGVNATGQSWRDF